jgi:DHA2 family multidrug resistance protein
VSGIMNLSRNMGGDLGIAFVTTLIARRAQTHQTNLSSHTTSYDPQYQASLQGIASTLAHAGSSSFAAAKQATALMYRRLVLQSTELAYLDALFILGCATACMVPLVWLSPKPQGRGAPAGAH